MYGEIQLISWLREHWGSLGLAGGILVYLAVKFLPTYLQSLREQRLAALERRNRDRQWQENERASLRAQTKAAQDELHTILTNHIAHLQEEAQATRAFHTAAVEQLQEMTHQLKELRREHMEFHRDLEEVKGDVKVIRGQTA